MGQNGRDFILKNNTLEINQINATELSKYLFGNTILSNIFLLGYAIQKGLIPISINALEKAIQINNVSVEENLSAFNWGRLAAEDIKYIFKKCNLIINKYRFGLVMVILNQIDSAWAWRFLIKSIRPGHGDF